jgi:hypothetical protein
MKKKSENLIVIIGNGFDLAHGLETSYNDFANYYLNEIVLTKILDYKNNEAFFNSRFLHYLNQDDIRTFNDLSTDSIKEDFLNNASYFVQKNKIDKVFSFLNSNNSFIQHIISNRLLGKLYSNTYENWFDIEQAYYNELLNIFHKKENQISLINKLNQDFKEIKDVLKKYLNNEIEPTYNSDVYSSFCKHFFLDVKNVSFINFNYTSVINSYLNTDYHSGLKEINNIHVHGNLKETDIIFGYGDDTNNTYQQIKDSKNNLYLKYFKTFDYFKSNNYRKVLNQLAIFDNYNVLVIGHSLGITDKTILKTILDTEKCVNIELLKRNNISDIKKEETLFELQANLSRIFTSDIELRKKLIPNPSSVHFPTMIGNDHEIIKQREKELYIKEEKSIPIDPGVY